MQNQEQIEVDILGNIILDNSKFDIARNIIDETGWTNEFHKALWLSMKNLHTEKKPIDYPNLIAQLEKHNCDYELIDLIDLADLAYPFFKSALDVFAKRSIKNKISQEYYKISMEASSNIYLEDIETEIRKANELIESEIAKLTQKAEPLSEIEKKYTTELKDKTYYYKTQFQGLNNIISGFRKGKYIIIASWSSVGKTTFALNLLNYFGSTKNIPTAFFSLETTDTQLYENLLLMESEISNYNYQSKLITDDEQDNLIHSIQKLRSAPIYIYDSPNITIQEISSKLKKSVIENKIEIAFIDYFQLIKPEKNRHYNREQELSAISKEIRALAIELNIPIIVLAQLRDIEYADIDEIKQEKKKVVKPTQYHLRESKSVFHDCDVCIMLHRESYFTNRNNEKASLIVRKNKIGKTGACDIKFKPENFLFYG